jgi:hypothetical protein
MLGRRDSEEIYEPERVLVSAMNEAIMTLTER